MASKQAYLPGIGRVFLYKRRGAKNIRLSVTAGGKVRVSLPAWAPYSAGLAFASSRSGWLQEQLRPHRQSLLKNGQTIGKAHRLYFQASSGKTSSPIAGQDIVVKTRNSWMSEEAQSAARKACERALRQEATHLLPQRLDYLANKHGYRYKEVKIKKLTGRWGSCSSAGVITLSYYLMQLPWQLIDYVLVHELAHTKHPNHQSDFWRLVQKAVPDFKQKRKEIRQFKPSFLTS